MHVPVDEVLHMPAPSPCNCLTMRRASRLLTQFYDRALAPTGLRVTQYSILAKVHRFGPVTIQELAEHLVLDRTSLSHNLRPLERDGLVEVRVGADRRVRAIHLTPAGEARLSEARPLWEDAQRSFEAGCGVHEARDLRRALDRAVAVTTGVLAGAAVPAE